MMKKLLLLLVFGLGGNSAFAAPLEDALESRGIAPESIQSASLTRPDLEIRPKRLKRSEIQEVMNELATASRKLKGGKIAPKFELAIRLKTGSAYLVVSEDGQGYLQQGSKPELRFTAPELQKALSRISSGS